MVCCAIRYFPREACSPDSAPLQHCVFAGLQYGWSVLVNIMFFQTFVSVLLPLSLVILFCSALFDVKSFKVIMSEPPLRLLASEAL